MPLRAAGWWITVFSISFHLAMIDSFSGQQILSITAHEKVLRWRNSSSSINESALTN
jgi:hypothetical protein